MRKWAVLGLDVPLRYFCLILLSAVRLLSIDIGLTVDREFADWSYWLRFKLNEVGDCPIHWLLMFIYFDLSSAIDILTLLLLVYELLTNIVRFSTGVLLNLPLHLDLLLLLNECRYYRLNLLVFLCVDSRGLIILFDIVWLGFSLSNNHAFLWGFSEPSIFWIFGYDSCRWSVSLHTVSRLVRLINT